MPASPRPVLCLPWVLAPLAVGFSGGAPWPPAPRAPLLPPRFARPLSCVCPSLLSSLRSGAGSRSASARVPAWAAAAVIRLFPPPRPRGQSRFVPRPLAFARSLGRSASLRALGRTARFARRKWKYLSLAAATVTMQRRYAPMLAAARRAVAPAAALQRQGACARVIKIVNIWLVSKKFVYLHSTTT